MTRWAARCSGMSPYGPCSNYRALAAIERCHAHSTPDEREAIEINARCHRLYGYIHGAKWLGMPPLFRNSRQRPPWIPSPGRVENDAGMVSLLRTVFSK